MCMQTLGKIKNYLIELDIQKTISILLKTIKKYFRKTCKKVIGKFKGKKDSKIISEFVGLRLKMQRYLGDNDNDKNLKNKSY